MDNTSDATCWSNVQLCIFVSIVCTRSTCFTVFSDSNPTRFYAYEYDYLSDGSRYLPSNNLAIILSIFNLSVSAITVKINPEVFDV
jgi:hypothetical protein